MEGLLRLLALLLLLGGSGWGLSTPARLNGASSSSHSLHYFYTSVSEPGQGLPQFIVVGYVDDQLFVQYDSDTRKFMPRTPWMETVGKEDPQYWDRNTQKLWNAEPVFRGSQVNLQRYYNQSGFHSLQLMYGCELRGDRSTWGYMQYAYDGRDYIALDKETLTWTAADTQAQITKRKWEVDMADAQRDKAYLEETCIEWLQRYLDYGNETLLRTEPPVGKVTRKASSDGLEILICQVHGFYPMEIDATWRRDGEILDYETLRKTVAPNSDGTYYIWLSVEIYPEERGHFQCHVGHASLLEPLVLAWEEPSANVMFIVGAILGPLAVVLVASGIYFFTRKQRMTMPYPRKNNQMSNRSSYCSAQHGI